MAAAVAAELAGAPLCGNGAIDPEEQCDGANLNGQTCVTLGYERGALSCSAACAFNTSGCQIDHRPATGQTTSYTAGDDGSVQAGHALSYVDNGDGTITDLNTHLMWEKKVALDSAGNVANLHDADNCYPWRGSCHTGGAACSVDADCGANGPCDVGDCQTASPNGLTIFKWVAQLNTANFAGHNDWRIPNKKELEGILDEGTLSPAVAPAFQGASCAAACTDMTSPACSCTVSGFYWSSTTFATGPYYAWVVDFYNGVVLYDGETVNYYVRAVRGGL